MAEPEIDLDAFHRPKHAGAPVLRHRGVSIYPSFKCNRALSYWYALEPRHDAELDDSTRDFDVRELPSPYTEGLALEAELPPTPLRSTDGMGQAMGDERRGHLEAIRRAIDDGFDLASFAARNGPDPWLARFLRPLFRWRDG